MDSIAKQEPYFLAAGGVFIFALIILCVRYRKFLLKSCCTTRQRMTRRATGDTRGRGVEEEARSERIGARFFLRSSAEYELQGAVTEMGIRRNKAYLLVKRKENRENLVMVASRLPAFAKDLMVLPEQREKFSYLLREGLRSRYLEHYSDVKFATGEGLLFTFQRLHPFGSLRDVICSVSARCPYSEKYAYCPSKGLPEGEARQIAQQVLRGLRALRAAGLPPHGHLHTGNIMVPARGVAVVGEYASSVLCVPERRHEGSIRVLKGDESGDPDVVCAGHVLHEMAYGTAPVKVPPGEGHVHAGEEPLTVGEAAMVTLVKGTRPTVEGMLGWKVFSGDVGDRRGVVEELGIDRNEALAMVQHSVVVLAGELAEASRRFKEEEVTAHPDSTGFFGAALRLEVLLQTKTRRTGRNDSPRQCSKFGGSMKPLLPV